MAEKARSISGGDSGEISSEIAMGGHHHYHDLFHNAANFSNSGGSIADNYSIMNVSQISSAPPVDSASVHGVRTNLNISHNIGGVKKKTFH